MAVSTSVSLVLSTVFAVMVFSTMQLYRPWFASTQWNTILGGYIGSWLFILALTAISNLETIVLGDGFQTKLFPEICFCLVGTMFACGTIHRVCATTCFLFSIFALYFVNKISQKAQNSSMPAVDTHVSSKKKRK